MRGEVVVQPRNREWTPKEERVNRGKSGRLQGKMNDEEGKRGEIEEIEEEKRSRRKSLLTVRWWGWKGGGRRGEAIRDCLYGV